MECSLFNIKFFKKDTQYKISIILMFIIGIIINTFIYSQFLNEERQFQKILSDIYISEVERVIGKDFKNLFLKNLNGQDLTIIKNYIYNADDNKNNEYINNIVYASNNNLYLRVKSGTLIIDLSNVKSILDDISKDIFLYSISINNIKILTNTLNNIDVGSFLSLPIGNNITLNISLMHDPFSPYLKLSNEKTRNKVYSMICISFIMLIIGWLIIYFYYKNKKELNLEKNHNSNIFEFLKRNKDYIVKCYEYSKKTHDSQSNVDYLPIPIIHKKDKSEPIKIIINQFIESINDYFHYYKLAHQLSNLELDMVTSLDLKLLVVPFDEEVFHQIIVSIIYNLMNFNKKSTGKRKITVNFDSEKIIISSDGLKLNQEYAIKASEMVFQDTVNPYLMNFGQIFVLFSKYNIKFDISHKSKGTLIEIILPVSESVNGSNFRGVINLKKYRDNKIG